MSDAAHDAAGETRVWTGRRWLVLALASGVSFTLYLHRYAWSMVKPAVQAEFPDLSAERLGWLDAAFSAAYALGQVPAGLAGDWLGPRVVLSAILAAWSAALVGLALAQGFAALCIGRIAFGLATAGCYPNLGKVTRAWFPVQVRTTVQGIVASLSGRAGGACASLLVGSLLMAGLGQSWRASLATIALGGMALAVAFWLLFRDRPGEATADVTSDVAAGDVTRDAATGVRRAAENAAVPVLSRITHRPAAWLAFAALLGQVFCATFADNFFAFWLPTYLRSQANFSLAQSGLYSSLPLWGGALGGLCGGALNDLAARRLGSRRWARSFVGGAGQTLAAGLIVLTAGSTDGRTVMWILLAAKFFIDWSQPTTWGAITDMAGPSGGAVFGVVNAVGSVGAFLAGPLMGRVIDHHGWPALFYGVAAVYLCGAACWLAVDCTKVLVEEENAGGNDVTQKAR